MGWKLWCSEAAAFEQASEPDIGPPSIPLGIYYEKDEMHIPSFIGAFEPFECRSFFVVWDSIPPQAPLPS